MAGIYIHIPFCRQKCSYCDFHFSTDSSYAQRMVDALCSELKERSRGYGQSIRTIYFGGGTPSVLSSSQLEQILKVTHAHYDTQGLLECTLEANPEDITTEVIAQFKALGINRLSMGIQSFDNEVLQAMNRSHDAGQALNAVRLAQAGGIPAITVDVIYGLPQKSLKDFEADLDQFLQLEVPHISAYALTIEPGTLFHHQQKKGLLTMPDDNVVEQQFYSLRSKLSQTGYEQYEVSNFAHDGHISKHNSAYWLGAHYIGIGPSAHSYDGDSRSWNPANNFKYMQGIERGELQRESESLDLVTRYNEYILTRLRTKWGLDLKHIQDEFGVNLLKDYATNWAEMANKYDIRAGHLILRPEGLILADGLSSALFKTA